jgi:tetratricopeptide (TPR) repeat protein
MPTKVKILWVFCNIAIVLGFISAAYTSKMEEVRLDNEAIDKIKQERALQKEKMSKMKKDQKVQTVHSVKHVMELNALGKHEEAATLAQKISENNPDNANVFAWWGISLVKGGLKSAAIEKFVRSTQLDPTNSKAFIYWGLTLAMDGRFKEAIEKYKTVIELDPEHSNAYAYMGASFDQLRKYEEARQNAVLALEIDPKNSVGYKVLIEVLSHSQNYEDAWAAVERAEKANINLPEKLIEELSQNMSRPKI